MQFTVFTFKLVVPIFFFLRSLIYPQSAMNGVFSFVLRPNTIWPGVDRRVVWYMVCTTKYVADNIPDQGSSLSR